MIGAAGDERGIQRRSATVPADSEATSDSDQREEGSGIAADDRTAGSGAKTRTTSEDGRQATGPRGWVGGRLF